MTNLSILNTHINAIHGSVQCEAAFEASERLAMKLCGQSSELTYSGTSAAVVKNALQRAEVKGKKNEKII